VSGDPVKVLVLAEYYPRAADPALGIWAHRQACAARDAGAEIRVLVLHRPIPPLAALRRPRRAGRALADVLAQPAGERRDGIRVDYLRYLSPPRPLAYASWGRWAAGPLRRALRRIRGDFPFDLAHAHYAVPAGDALRRAAPDLPLLVSVHGGDVLGAHAHSAGVHDTLAHARLVLANSAGTARRCTDRGARKVRVLHLGTDLPPRPAVPPATPTIVSVGNLIARKRHGDLIEAVARLTPRHPQLRCVIAGDGPERERLIALAQARGVADRIRLLGAVAPAAAVQVARSGTLFVLPSVAEAFGVAYIEAMAAGVPAIGSRGEDGPEEIAASGGGIELVAPGDPAALAEAIDALLSDPVRREALGRRGRETVATSFTWERCGRETVAAYAELADG
jgi:teichuronic acid biosynthesis glycosyltransferase TuaC